MSNPTVIAGPALISGSLIAISGIIGVTAYATFRKYNRESEDYTRKFNLGSDEASRVGGNWDAFRHAYTSAMLTWRYGETIAHTAADLNEAQADLELFSEHECAYRNMDYWNNAAGRRIGLKYRKLSMSPTSPYRNRDNTKDAIANSIYRALKNGELITGLNDPREYTGPYMFDPLRCNPVPTPIPDPSLLSDPLTLDLDGDGVIETLPIEAGGHFDLDNSGFAERTGWVAADDGLVVLDLNGNGQIDGGAGRDRFRGLDSDDTLYSDDESGDADRNYRQAA